MGLVMNDNDDNGKNCESEMKVGGGGDGGGESWTKERLLKMEYIQFPVFEWLNPKELCFVVIFF